jgi:hypothetical protein
VIRFGLQLGDRLKHRFADLENSYLLAFIPLLHFNVAPILGFWTPWYF